MREPATNYEPLIDSKEVKIIPQIAGVSVLKILNVTDNHAGRYKCVAANELGTAEHVTSLKVECKYITIIICVS